MGTAGICEGHMADRSGVKWKTCTEGDCLGVRLPTGQRCWAHGNEDEVEATLKQLGEHGHVDARGVLITQGIIGRILGAAPRDDYGHAVLVDAQFDRAAFDGDAEFEQTIFNGDAVFDWVTFHGDANFIAVTFQRDAGFDLAAFHGHAAFGKATFQRDAWFNGATFQRDAWLVGATFDGDARFDEATFQQRAVFYEAIVDGDAPSSAG